jgi:hypothetical protein
MDQCQPKPVQRLTPCVGGQAHRLIFGQPHLAGVVVVPGQPGGIQADDVDGEGKSRRAQGPAITKMGVKIWVRQQFGPLQITPQPIAISVLTGQECVALRVLKAPRCRAARQPARQILIVYAVEMISQHLPVVRGDRAANVVIAGHKEKPLRRYAQSLQGLLKKTR